MNKISMTKSMRNRLIGLLVIISLVMIVVPAMMDPEQIYTKDESAIAVNSQGAVTDSSGQLVSAAERDYTDLLAPEDDGEGMPLPSASPAEPLPADAPAAPEEELFPAEDFGPAPAGSAAQPPSAAQEEPDSLPSAQGPSPQAAAAPAPAPEAAPAADSVKGAAAPAPAPAPAAPGGTGDFGVQVGVFSNQGNADQVLARLKMSGYKPLTQTISINGKPAIRIYAAFSQTREGARSIAQEVEKRTGYKCNVVSR